MKFKDFYLKLCEFAPLSLSGKLCETDGCYDNSGIIVEPKKEEINSILFTLDLTSLSVEKAIKEGFDLIVTHHPAIYSPIKCLLREDPVYKAINEGVGVVSFHLNLDCAREGIDFWLAKGLGGETFAIMQDFGDGCGYGRASETEEITAGELLEKYKTEFETDKATLYGDRERKICKIASFCGAGADENALDFAEKNGVDLIASADIKHHILLKAIEKNMAVLALSHYGSENYGMKKTCGIFAREFKNEKIVFFDDGRFS